MRDLDAVLKKTKTFFIISNETCYSLKYNPQIYEERKDLIFQKVLSSS